MMMASGRFFGDALINKVGRKRVMQISGIMISNGFLHGRTISLHHSVNTCFHAYRFGRSTVVPTLYSIAGKHPTIPTGEALTAVSSVSFLGFLMGPPVIGYIAELSSLRFSFAFIGIFGFAIALMVSRIKAIE